MTISGPDDSGNGKHESRSMSGDMHDDALHNPARRRLFHGLLHTGGALALGGVASTSLFGLLGVSGRAVAATPAPGSDRMLTISYPVDVPSWDPTAATATQMQSIFETVYDSPLRFAPDQTLAARQIASWSWEDKHATRLAVTLRDDILFHDGSRLTTTDLKWSLLDRPRAQPKLAINGLFSTLTQVEIQSPTKAVLVYGRPSPTAPIYLGFLSGYILPRAYIERVGENNWTQKPIGAGPYRVVDYQRNSRIVLEAFPKYWGGAPAISRVTFEIANDPAARVAAIESGHAGLAVQIPIREIKRLAAVPHIKTSLHASSEIYQMRIPSGRAPFTDDNVRAAMHLAVDRGLLSKAFYAGMAPVLSTFGTKGSAADDASFQFPFDRAKAVAALAKSGYSTSKPVRLTLYTTNGAFPSDFDMARAIAGMWQQVGIQADVVQTTPAQAIADIHAGKLDGVLLESWANATGDPENFSGRMFDPTLVFSSWKDPALGPRIAALMTEVDSAKRLAGYHALADEASSQSWGIPLLQSVSALAYRDDVELTVFASGYVLPVEYRFKG